MKESRKANFSAWYFIIFIISVGLHKFNYLNTQLFGFNLQQTVGISLLALPLIFLILAYFSGARDKSIEISRNSEIVNLIFGYTVLLLIYGLVSGNFAQRAVEEFWTACIIYFSYKLGTNTHVWELFKGKLNLVYFIFAIFVFLGTGYSQETLTTNINLEASFQGVTVATEAYNVSPILDFWPFLLLFGIYGNESIGKRILSYLPFFIYLGFQLFFIKRAPTVRAIAHFAFASIILVYIRGVDKKAVRTLLLLFAFIAFSYFAIPKDLAERFKTEDNARQNELKGMLEQLTPLQLIFGKGLGGEYIADLEGVSERTNNSGAYVKSTLHIGFGDSILKGGLILFSLIFIHFLYVFNLVMKNYKSLTPQEFVSISFLVVFLIFRLIEGGLTPGSIFSAFCYGISFGTLEQIKYRVKVYKSTF
jgi:hypothetical protein